MHVLLIHQAFAALDDPGGTRHHELARYLAETGHQVSIIASPVSYLTGRRQKPEKMTVDASGRVVIHRVYTYAALHKSFLHRVISFLSFMLSSFLKSLSIRNVDLVWGTSPPIFQSFTAWLVARLKGKPFLLEVRDLWPDFAIAVGVLRSPLLIRLSRWLESFLYRRAQRLMVNSPGFIQHVRARGAQDVHLIPNGADPAFFEVNNSQNRQSLFPSLEGKFIVLYAGAHGMSNDLEIVLQAAEILSIYKEIHFVLIGDGKEKPALQKMAKEMQLSNLEFRDPLPKMDMPAIIIAADACLAILKPIEMYKTTYPNKVFDYMAAAKPVVLAIDGVIREVVEEANCGLFCQPGDAQSLALSIRTLYQDPVAAMQMGQNGRDYLAKTFNRATIAQEFIRLVQEMVG